MMDGGGLRGSFSWNRWALLVFFHGIFGVVGRFSWRFFMEWLVFVVFRESFSWNEELTVWSEFGQASWRLWMCGPTR